MKKPAKEYYRITHGRLGPSAVLYNAKGRVINAINGAYTDTEASVRRAAQKHWSDATERK